VREIGAEGIVPKRDRSHYRGDQSWKWLKTGSSDRHVPPHQIEGRRVPRNATANCGERERFGSVSRVGLWDVLNANEAAQAGGVAAPAGSTMSRSASPTLVPLVGSPPRFLTELTAPVAPSAAPTRLAVSTEHSPAPAQALIGVSPSIGTPAQPEQTPDPQRRQLVCPAAYGLPKAKPAKDETHHATTPVKIAHGRQPKHDVR
jgi:hypothetical protein